jgi:non-ribosomal peptide synthetase component F
MNSGDLEKTQMVWNRTERSFSSHKAVHQLFEEQAERTPDGIALEVGSGKYTYRHLDGCANRLARYLTKLGLRQNQIIGILAERSEETIVAILAVLKAGAAYLPLDPAYPKQRLSMILEHARPEMVIHEPSLEWLLPDSVTKRVCIGEELIAEDSELNSAISVSPSDLAYVIYTSGSTGRPKGVKVTHRSRVNHTEAAMLNFSLSPQDKVLQFASLAFDTSLEEIFPCLCSGATLVLRSDAMLASTSVFLAECHRLGITQMDLPTSFWHHLVADLEQEHVSYFNKIKKVIIGGEAVNYSYWSILRKWTRFVEYLWSHRNYYCSHRHKTDRLYLGPATPQYSDRQAASKCKSLCAG